MCGQGELVPWPNLLIPMEREVPTTGNEVTRSHSGNEAEPGVQSRNPASACLCKCCPSAEPCHLSRLLFTAANALIRKSHILLEPHWLRQPCVPVWTSQPHRVLLPCFHVPYCAKESANHTAGAQLMLIHLEQN